MRSAADLGTTDWVTITQDQINEFADATLDNQWIHVDTERAKAGPFGTPIAHGYLTMSLAAHFLVAARARRRHLDGHQLRRRQGALPRAGAGRLEAAGRGRADRCARRCRAACRRRTRITIEREGGDKPVAIVDTIAGTSRDRAGRVPARRQGRDRHRRGPRHRRVDRATYAEAGANIVLAARTKEQLDEVAGDVRGVGRDALVDRRATSTTTTCSKALVDQAVGEFGRIDIVVNNAGGTMPRPFLDTSPGFLERSFHFNVTTAFVLSKAAAPHLLASGDGRDREHLVGDRAPPRPRVRRVRHRQSRACRT